MPKRVTAVPPASRSRAALQLQPAVIQLQPVARNQSAALRRQHAARSRSAVLQPRLAAHNRPAVLQNHAANQLAAKRQSVVAYVYHVSDAARPAIVAATEPNCQDICSGMEFRPRRDVAGQSLL